MLFRSEKSIESAKKGVESAGKIKNNSENDLKVLEKLGKLRKAGVITEKEFQSKKKKILGRI